MKNPTWNFCYATPSNAAACNRRLWRQEQRLQVVEEPLAQGRHSPSASSAALQQTLALPLGDGVRNRRKPEARARFVVAFGEVLGQPQHIEHVLERQFRALDRKPIADALGCGTPQEFARLLDARAANDRRPASLGVRKPCELAVCA